MRPLTFVSLAESETSLAGCSYSFSLDFNATPTKNCIAGHFSSRRDCAKAPKSLSLILDMLDPMISEIDQILDLTEDGLLSELF